MKVKIIAIIHLLLGMTSIIIGILLQIEVNKSKLFTSNQNDIHLDLIEVNTYYENNTNLEYINYVNSLWTWPTDSNYSISNPYSSYHPAIDIIPSSNYEIYSAQNGEVITNSYNSVYGNYLVIKQDNGYYTLYAHLSQPLVTVGQKVQKGQLLGIMGKTGTATGIHLHFSIWDGYPFKSNSINPLDFYKN